MSTSNGQDRDGSRRCVPRLPLSKVKRIAKADPEHTMLSSTAVVATAFATELFLGALVEDSLLMNHLRVQHSARGKAATAAAAAAAAGGAKQLRLGYRDVLECVQRKEQFQFLEDAIPKSGIAAGPLNTLARVDNRAVTNPDPDADPMDVDVPVDEQAEEVSDSDSADGNDLQDPEQDVDQDPEQEQERSRLWHRDEEVGETYDSGDESTPHGEIN
ncbi:DNA polymerase epsilon noncatalytic subunit KNAG_0C01710 [Huiozyma naganishii CBS 8797]|uniref:Transcription factor CBF/NF-Y/archaeal histone domain-containing protein n=1 Tax=Huiozyma naganishii (strain ATCC MYA-139 / BCRC 22969 / CBS 8797 / KCTC 17520 / NBRC 10181 / NCYC 3082 / Yp74L-3) TaxID=1071383 RepID=J7R377_HUIN7|nr:hypothetical protein KNAG_0C01710 [Kazachstania naganishii CBS 8797]CCK69285.1 hypothetical protein KNAG_0C01710 [Kazachstania naganishii CBS 8797]